MKRLSLPPAPISRDSRMSSSMLEWREFSEEEKELLIKSWALIQPQKQNVGCDIYEMIFNQCPETRYLFPKIDTRGSKRELRKNNEFVFQALRFMQSAMRNLESLNNMNTILENLGRRHGKLEFRGYYWSTFIECMIFNFRKFLENCRKFSDKEVDAAIIVWRYLIQEVVQRIKVGYANDIEHRLTQLEANCQSISLDGKQGQRPLRKQSSTYDDPWEDVRGNTVLNARQLSSASSYSLSSVSHRRHFLKKHSVAYDDE